VLQKHTWTEARSPQLYRVQGLQSRTSPFRLNWRKAGEPKAPARERGFPLRGNSLLCLRTWTCPFLVLGTHRKRIASIWVTRLSSSDLEKDGFAHRRRSCCVRGASASRNKSRFGHLKTTRCSRSRGTFQVRICIFVLYVGFLTHASRPKTANHFNGQWLRAA
jgi:hypothetical protein